MSNHSFDIHIATEYKSVDVAILVWHFQYWIMKNKALGRNLHEGRTWTYQTQMEIAAVFPYFSRDQVKRLLKKSVDLGILIKGNFNKNSFDQTSWYAFANETKFAISQIPEMEDVNESSSGIGRKRPIDISISPIGMAENAQCYKDTDTLPYTLTNKEREGGKPPPAHSVSVCKIERQPFVTTSAKEHDALIAKLGEPKTQAAYEKLSLWKQNTSKSKWKKNDSLTIQNWVIDALLEDEEKQKKRQGSKVSSSIEEIITSHREWFKGVEIKIPHFPQHESYYGYADYVQFSNHPTNNHSEKIYFKEPKFKDFIKHELLKRKYTLKAG